MPGSRVGSNRRVVLAIGLDHPRDPIRHIETMAVQPTVERVAIGMLFGQLAQFLVGPFRRKTQIVAPTIARRHASR